MKSQFGVNKLMTKTCTISVSLILSLFLSACADSDNDDDNNNNNNGTESGAGTPVPEMDYRIQLIAPFAGSYNGECVSFPDERSIQAPVVIAANGDVTTQGATGSLTGSKVNVMISRKFNKQGQVESFQLNGNDTNSDKGLNVELKAGIAADSSSAAARQGVGDSGGVRCLKSAEAAALLNRSVYTVISKFIPTETMTVTCVKSESVTRLDYSFAGDTVKIGDETFLLTSNLSQESAGVIPSNEFLVYNIKTLDDREFSITVDRDGGLNGVGFRDRERDTFACVP